MIRKRRREMASIHSDKDRNRKRGFKNEKTTTQGSG
jgi:hypothetical protein